MPVLTRSAEPLALMFADDGSVPNNPRLPFLVYRNAIDLTGNSNPAEMIEKIFAGHRWGDMWRNGIFPYVHYHSMIHEALAVARGRAKVRFGGDNGEAIDVMAGDVVVLPAGIGHQRLTQTPDLVVIGAYPPNGQYNLCRDSKAEHAQALAVIPNVPPPEADPVFGPDGPLLALWQA
jgi:uncharacterized protein YjlB